MRAQANSLRLRGLIVIVLVVLIVACGATFLLATRTHATPQQQPIAFNHQVMVQLGIQCLFCHTDAQRSPSPGMPSVEKCMGCHRVIATNVPVIQQVAGYWERQQPIPWERVNTLPRFVYFTHEVHITAGKLNCERCHGDVGHMTVARPVVRMNMGWCLSCHESQPNAAQLQDCVVCHQ
jgi:hypothetical protein